MKSTLFEPEKFAISSRYLQSPPPPGILRPSAKTYTASPNPAYCADGFSLRRPSDDHIPWHPWATPLQAPATRSSEGSFADPVYRQRIREAYQAHPDFKERGFDFFYQAQVLWDEAMAEAIDRFLRHNPDRQMVVLAGDGHLSFGSGIPQRVSRRNGFAFSILLNGEDVEKNAADYLLYPGSLSWESTPKLMVFLKEEEGRVVIERFSPGNVSEKAGLQKGDRILALDILLFPHWRTFASSSSKKQKKFRSR
jgi:hypothetical protein